jgi:hypothetical protein
VELRLLGLEHLRSIGVLEDAKRRRKRMLALTLAGSNAMYDANGSAYGASTYDQKPEEVIPAEPPQLPTVPELPDPEDPEILGGRTNF